MSEQKFFFSTLPGILTGIAGLVTAVAGLIYALSESGLIRPHGKDQTPHVAAAPVQPASANQPVGIESKTSKQQTTDGWAIIGHYKQGKFLDLKLMVHGDGPASGRSYDVVDAFRLVQKKAAGGQAVITLGMVHRGDSVEVLDIEIEPGTRKVPVYAKLRAVLRRVERPSR